MVFTLTTFGTCRLEDEGGRVMRVPAQALVMLAYLYDRGQPVTKRNLAELLWPGRRDASATNLRSMLLRLGPTGQALIRTEGTTLSVNYEVLRCDLDLPDCAAPVERLRALGNAVAMQFLPAAAKGSGALDLWIRDVRARLAADLRATFFAISNRTAGADIRAELRRAAIVLLDVDPHDEQVRHALLPVSAAAVKSACAAPQWADPASPATGPRSDMLAPPRIALLPPEIARDAERQGSVANALIEDLTITLCSSQSVSVVAPYTAERIRASRDKGAILEQHRVIYALDTKRSDDWLFAQLVFMPSDEIVWARRFPLNPADIAQHRVTIAEAIQHSITERIGAGAAAAVDFHQRPEAYFSYLRGLQSLSKLSLPGIRRARRFFREALDQEQDFAAALAGISRTLTMEWVLTAQGDRELLDHAEKLAGQAIHQDNAFAGGFKELGVSQLYLGKIDESLVSLGEAERISPHYADALWSHADSLVHASSPDRALAKVTVAIDLNPLSPDTYFWTAAGASYFMRQYADALDYIGRMGDSAPAARLAAACWGMLGDHVRARACRLKVLKKNPDFDLERWLQMIPHRERWQTELYREGLTKAGF